MRKDQGNWLRARMLLEEQGARLKYWRKVSGLSQTQVGGRVGATGPEICAIEAGRQVPTARQAQRLSEWVLQISQSHAHGLSGVRVPRVPSPARTGDPDTSHAAADSVDPFKARALHVKQLRYLTQNYHPDTEWWKTHQGMWVLGVWPPTSESGFRTRMSELKNAGLVADTGRRAKLRVYDREAPGNGWVERTSGRLAVVWEITDAGRAYLAEHDEAD